jgi:type I restriction enzyme, S subunit
MVGEWITVPLDELVHDIIDRRGVTPLKLGSDFVPAGYRVISAKTIKNRKVDLSGDDARFVDDATYRRWMKTPLRADDVLLTSEAPLGEPAYIPSDIDYCLGQRLFAIRTNKRLLQGRFLFYALQSDAVRNDLLSRATGTTAQGIRQTELRRVQIPVPEVNEQRAIAHILGALDDKIEVNRRMSATLEAMARTLFKSWFVDFDPVRAKAEGRDTGLPDHLATLFPDRFVESQLGEIPEGWEVGCLGDVCHHPRRSVRPSEIDPQVPYIALEHMPKRSIALSDWGWGDGLESNKYAFRRGEILFGKLRPYFHKVGVAPVAGVCSTDIVVAIPQTDSWFGFVLGHISSVEFVDYTDAGSTGTKMPRTSWTEMARYELVLPPEPVAAAFTNLNRPYVERIITSIHETRTLAALRDTLLPKLISGELRVQDAEGFLERVT